MAAPMACRCRFVLCKFMPKSSGRHVLFYQAISQRCCSTTSSGSQPSVIPTTSNKEMTKTKRISKAMQAYIDRAKKHDETMRAEIAEYELGKRHLANIMGKDPDTFQQEDIDKAISYLLPSGIFDKKARPALKHPYEIFPRRKAAQFGMDGRPFHYLFYTGKPNFYQIMHEAALKIGELNTHQEDMIKKGFRETQPHEAISLKGSEWIDLDALKSRMVENQLNEHDHNAFVVLFNRLGSHPYSNHVKDFIMQFRMELAAAATTQRIPEANVTEDGRKWIEAEGKRKKCVAKVQLWDQGTGQVTINDRYDLLYFKEVQSREQIMFPLALTGKLGEVDIVATVSEGGTSSQSGAVRHGLSLALRSFVDADTVEKMRLAGLLTRDIRRKERNKPGQWKARKKWTWKKR